MEKMKERKYHFPPINLLVKAEVNSVDREYLLKTAAVIKQTLAGFGIRIKITGLNIGTLLIRYEIVPEMGTRVSSIMSRADDLKVALGTADIRIEAPIPGKAAIGIEVANNLNTIVTIREMIESKEFKEFPSNFVCAVGKDSLGNRVVVDLAKMPNLLIGGTTGSGKTVLISSLIMSILYKAHPNDVKMIMIDTKGVSLNIYNGIPHLIFPVITDARKALSVLQWAIAERQDRYNRFAEYGMRDLKGYNYSDRIQYKLPQILIIIDDLSDLMTLYKTEAEELIIRIAQLSRAAGIHFVIATQRPSTDVVTGLIKANIPSRIAFSVFSAIDSRVILDEKGAEKLLGNGDMLFKQQGYLRPIRIQGAYISDSEITGVVSFLINQSLGNVYKPDIAQKKEKENNNSERDTYFEEAGKLVIEKDKASIGMLQRHFKIGFNRASQIMDELCEAGVVREEDGTKPRSVLMSIEQFKRQNLI